MSSRDPIIPEVLRRPLSRVARRHIVSALGSGLARFALALLGLLLAQMTLDRVLDFSTPVRACLLVLDAVVLGLLVWKRLVRPWLKRWRASDAAFALQRRWPVLGSRVISAVQLHAGLRPGAGSPLLVEALVAETGGLVGALRIGDAVPLKSLARLVAAAFAAGVLAVGIAAWQPHMVGVLLRRVALQNVPLPTSTIVRPETRDLKVAVGGTLDLSAFAEGVIPARGRVELVFADGEKRQVQLTPDPAKSARFSFNLANLRQSFRYRFYLGDGRGPSFEASVLPTPVLVEAEFRQEFPAYTGRAPLRQPAGALTFFAGSKITLTARLNLPASSAQLVFAGSDVPAPLKLTPDSANPRVVRGEFTLGSAPLAGVSVPAVSTDGLVSVSPTVYPVQFELDAPPAITVLEPVASAETLVPTARLPLRLRVKDNFGVAKIELVVESAATGQTRVPLDVTPNGQIAHNLIPAEINPALAPGMTLSWWIEAADNNDVTGPGIGRSDRRLITLVTLAEKQQEMLRRLDEASQRLEDVARRQGEIRDDIGEVLRRATPAPANP